MASTGFELDRTDAPVGRIEQPRFEATRIDYVLLLTVAALLLIGLMMAYSTTFDWSYAETGNSFSFLLRQMIWVAMGLLVMAILSRIDYMWWRRLAVPVMMVAIALLVLVLVFGSVVFGAQRTFLNGSIQPSEPAKIAIIIYVAAWLSSKGQKVRQMTYGLIPFSVLIGVVAGLIVLQPDFSTAVLIVLTASAMFFIAGADLLQVGVGCLISGGTFYLLIANSAHGSDRLSNFLVSWSDPHSVSHHVRQALVALGSGGVLGRGLGASYQKFGYLPAPHTDSVFAVLGEELGLAGCLVVVALFALLAQRGFKIALEAREPFGAVLAAGLTCWLMFQALINVAVMTATIPFTGIPLPFLSVGGSAMMSSLVAVGLLFSVSRGSRAAVTSGGQGRSGTASRLRRGFGRAQSSPQPSRQVRSADAHYRVRKGGHKRADSFLWRRNRRSRISRISRR
jgi:cell division protein FtsW